MHVKRREKLLARAKGYRWQRKSSIKLARVAVIHAGLHAYRDRRLEKRDMRALWQIQINAGARQHGLSYSRFMHGLKLAKVQLNRKMLADLAEREPKVFEAIVNLAKKTS